jgi:hypothetical protein
LSFVFLCFVSLLFFVCWLLSRCLASFFLFFLSDAGNEPGQSLCAGTHSEAARPCGAAFAADGVGQHVAGAGVTGARKGSGDGKKMVAAIEIMVARVEKKM